MTTATDSLPFEVKRLIADHVDLKSLKQLRLTSKVWAVVGLDLLLLPTFSIRSYARDIPRLLQIGNHPELSSKAAQIVRSVIFQTFDWEPDILRKILTNRHIAVSNWEDNDFVPTQAEQYALDELDAFIEQRKLDEIVRKNRGSLEAAFRVVPWLNTIIIACENDFKDPLLRKVWNEFSLETYRYNLFQMGEVMCTANRAGLTIEHLSHQAAIGAMFGPVGRNPNKLAFCSAATSLKSLDYNITELQLNFELGEMFSMPLKTHLLSMPLLEELSLKFNTLHPVGVRFLSSITFPNLHSLTLNGVNLRTEILFSFLERHRHTLKRLRFKNAGIIEPDQCWKTYLEKIKEMLGGQLEKFEISGTLRSKGEEDIAWFFWPIYEPDWSECEESVKAIPRPVGSSRKDVEDYVIRGGVSPIENEPNIAGIFT
ncbi:hypothetical protein BGZ60DRAFT_415273 [Tricladium varicosporioides]|nr:hypothetical protein BGZ60DRAFT_415273 [Hymenoscyphus varicosporioides]